MKDNARTVIAVGLAVVVGILALPFVFSDLSPTERIAERAAMAGSIFFLGGVLVGWVAIRRWPLSVLCAWTPFGMGVGMLTSKLTVQGELPYWSAIAAFLLVPLAVAIFGGYVGYRLASRIGNR